MPGRGPASSSGSSFASDAGTGPGSGLEPACAFAFAGPACPCTGASACLGGVASGPACPSCRDAVPGRIRSPAKNSGQRTPGRLSSNAVRSEADRPRSRQTFLPEKRATVSAKRLASARASRDAMPNHSVVARTASMSSSVHPSASSASACVRFPLAHSRSNAGDGLQPSAWRRKPWLRRCRPCCRPAC